MKKSWKMFLPLVICLALCMSLFTVSASAASKSTPGEVKQDDQGNWVALDKNGNPVKSGWVGETWQDAKGKTSKAWYYVSNGELLTGWHNVDGNWYFFEDKTDDTTKPWMCSDSSKYGPRYIGVEGDTKSTKAFNDAKNFWWFNADGTVGGESGWKSFMTTDQDGNPYRAWFYVNSDGTVAKGWKDDAGNWYELGNDFTFHSDDNANAQLVTGDADKWNGWAKYPNLWVDYMNGKVNYEDVEKMPNHWVNPDGTVVVNDWASYMRETPKGDQHRYWVFADEKGELVQGWNNIDGVWYYFGYPDPNTEKPYAGYYDMQENQNIKMDGNVYRVGKLGALVTGWAEDLYNDGEWNYFDPATGAEVQDQWKQIDGKWYYFDGDKAVHDGKFEYDGDTYYLGKDGVMQTGWVAENPDEWYKFGDDGVQQFGWVEDGGNWYYLREDTGELVVNDWVDGEYVGSDGAWVPETPVD